ncbi:MAG: POTRA domain-containing protein [bacterium]
MGRAALLLLLLLVGRAWADPPDAGPEADPAADAGPAAEAAGEAIEAAEDAEGSPEEPSDSEGFRAGNGSSDGPEDGRSRRREEQTGRRDPRLEAIVDQFRPLRGRPVLGVSIACDFSACAEPERNAVLRQITRLDRGTLLRPEDVADAWLRLVSTGLFRDLAVTAAPRGAQVEVRFTGVWAVVITDLRIEYDRLPSRLYPQQFRSEIRKRLSFRKGSSFPPQGDDGRFSEADQREIDDQRARIADLYERQGYEGTSVEFIPEYHGENRKFVRLVVRVQEGSQPEIGQVLIQGNRAFSYSRILAMLSTGERVDFWRGFFGAFGLGRYAQRQFREELKTVEGVYRSQGYVSARVRLEGTVQRRDGKVFPLVRVREGPRVTASFEGNDSLDDEELAGVLTFEGTGAFDDTEIASSIEAIKDLYQEVARYYVEVDARQEVRPDGVHVTFRIEEGPRVYVRAVEILGGQAISTDELRDAMETKGVAPDGVINTFVASSGVLQDARVINDLLALRTLYYDRGYLGVRFRCADPAWTWPPGRRRASSS